MNEKIDYIINNLELLKVHSSSMTDEEISHFVGEVIEDVQEIKSGCNKDNIVEPNDIHHEYPSLDDFNMNGC